MAVSVRLLPGARATAWPLSPVPNDCLITRATVPELGRTRQTPPKPDVSGMSGVGLTPPRDGREVVGLQRMSCRLRRTLAIFCTAGQIPLQRSGDASMSLFASEDQDDPSWCRRSGG